MKERENILKIFDSIQNELKNDEIINNEYKDDQSLKTLLKKHNWNDNDSNLKKLVEFFTINCYLAMNSDETSSGIFKNNKYPQEYF